MTAQGIRLERSVPVQYDVDVFVAGGGPAGVAAALAAASQGASVYLAEGQICFGGMGTAGGLSMFCAMSDGVNFVSDGVGRRVHDRLFAMGGNSPKSKPGDPDVYYRLEVLKRVYDDLVTEAGVQFTFATHVIGVECEGGWIRYAICWGKSGLFAVKAKAFVDATGDGDLCAWAGAKYEQGDENGRVQPGTLLSIWSNVNWQKAEAAGTGQWKQDHRLPEAFKDNAFSIQDLAMPGIIQSGWQTGNGILGHLFGIDGTDVRSLTQAAIQGRRQLPEYEAYFKRYLSGYEDMELACSGAVVGIRETRRIQGDYVLNSEDYFSRAVFKDEIGRFCYPPDLHPVRPEEGVAGAETFKRLGLGKGESYGIPYRVLTPRGLDNVLVAGRCVSTDRTVQGSLRVMAGCFITGQAAGTAAAMTAEQQTEIRSIRVCDLQSRLVTLGAFLPNAGRTPRATKA